MSPKVVMSTVCCCVTWYERPGVYGDADASQAVQVVDSDDQGEFWKRFSNRGKTDGV
jgi:hypothetical protein